MIKISDIELMKSTPLNTLLIPSVLLLWAVVIWRYVGPDIFKKNDGKAVQSSRPVILEKSRAVVLGTGYRSFFPKGIFDLKDHTSTNSAQAWAIPE